MTEVLNGVYVSWQGCNRLMFFELEGASCSTAGEGERECSTPDRDWTLPFAVTCSCLMSAEMMLFVGLADGSTVIWDTHLMTQVRGWPHPSACESPAWVGRSAG
jgi:hypothetical protein